MDSREASRIRRKELERDLSRAESKLEDCITEEDYEAVDKEIVSIQHELDNL